MNSAAINWFVATTGAHRRDAARFWIAVAGVALSLYSADLLAAPNATELARIHAKIVQLRQQSQAAETSRTEAVDALQQSERVISAANRSLYELEQQHNQTELALARLHTQIDSARKAVTQQQRELANLIRQQYFSAQSDAVKLLMSGKDPNQIARNLVYFGYIGRARNQLISTLQQKLNQLDQLTAAEQQQQIQLQQQRQQRQQQRQLLQTQRQQKKQVLKQLGS